MPVTPAPAGRPQAAGASWAFRPRSLGELVDRAAAVVEARVTRVVQAPPLAGTQPPIPTQRIHLDVTAVLKRGAGVAESSGITVFRTGGPSGRGELSLEGDPPYAPGQDYVLFLSARNATEFIPSAPDGRLLVKSDHTLKPLIAGPVASALTGTQSTELADRIADQRRSS